MSVKAAHIPGIVVWSILVVLACAAVGGAVAREAGPAQEHTGSEVVPDGAELFAKYCVQCHGSGIIEPGIRGLAKLRAEEIYHALANGIMREAAAGLDHAEHRVVAEYVASLNRDRPSAPSRGYCKTGPEAASRAGNGRWTGWSNDVSNSRHVAGGRVDLAQVRRMSLKWSFVFPDTASTTNAGNQPTVVNGILYIGHRNRSVYALDALTGCTYWSFKADAGVRSVVAVADGIAVFADYETNVYALDAVTGELKWRSRADDQPSSRVNGNVSLHEGVAYVPISSNQEFVNALDPGIPCCNFRGSVVAYDAGTGKRLWKSWMIEAPLRVLGTNSRGVEIYGPSGGAVWSAPTIDAGRAALYVGTGNQLTGPAVEVSDAVVALDLKSGRKRWVKSFVPARFGGQDIWNGSCVDVVKGARAECPAEAQGDRDLGAPVILQTRKDGSDVLLVGSKDGVLYALDPDREGAVIWQVRVGRMMTVKGPSFGGIEHGLSADNGRAYVPVADIDVIEEHAAGSLVAVDLVSGEPVWRYTAPADACRGQPVRCYNAYTAPTTVMDGILFSGSNDGYIRAHDIHTGQAAWEFNTAIAVTGVNGVTGSGGAINRSGSAIVNGMVYQTSGYGQGLGMPGNVLFAFEIPSE